MKIDVLKVIVLRKLIIFSKSYLQIIVFDKQQVKWLQTRKGKYQEKLLNSLEEVALSWSTNKILWKFPKIPKKDVLVRAETCDRVVAVDVVFHCYLFSKKSSILVVWMSSKYTSQQD